MGSLLKAIACVLVALMVVTGCAHRHKRSGGIYYRVKKGETLWRISYRFGVDIEELAAVNHIKDPSRIRAGQILYIPASKGKKKRHHRYHKRHEQKRKYRGTPAPPVAARKGRFIWPVKGRLLSGYGMRGDAMHKGVDIKAPRGTPVRAADGGVVVYSDDGMRGYGRVIIIEHPDGLFTVYAHNSKNLVRKGDKVRRGQVIATVGSTGNATTSHLHFEVRKGSRAINPLFFLP